VTDQQHFFDFAAEVGLTKHLGGLAATEQLVALCHIDQGTYVLDVGCGAVVTPLLRNQRFRQGFQAQIKTGMIQPYQKLFQD
jgi:hypothetical protein